MLFTQPWKSSLAQALTLAQGQVKVDHSFASYIICTCTIIHLQPTRVPRFQFQSCRPARVTGFCVLLDVHESRMDFALDSGQVVTLHYCLLKADLFYKTISSLLPGPICLVSASALKYFRLRKQAHP